MSEQTPPGYDPGTNPKAAAKAAKAYAKASRPWYKKKRWIIPLAILALIIIGSAANGGSSDDKTEPDKNIPAAADKPSVSASDSTEATPKTTKAKKKKEPKSTKGQVLLTASGHGQKQTQSFTAAGDWDLAYKWSSCGGVNLFQMYIYDGDNSPVGIGANTQEPSGDDVTHQHQGGEYYIEVNTACQWSMKVTSAE